MSGLMCPLTCNLLEVKQKEPLRLFLMFSLNFFGAEGGIVINAFCPVLFSVGKCHLAGLL
jgi:hypothetical protein